MELYEKYLKEDKFIDSDGALRQNISDIPGLARKIGFKKIIPQNICAGCEFFDDSRGGYSDMCLNEEIEALAKLLNPGAKFYQLFVNRENVCNKWTRDR